MSDIMRLYAEYAQAQMRANPDDDLAEQAGEMGQIVSRALMMAAKPKPEKSKD